MAAPKEKIIYVLTGPTAVGKTELSLAWAEANEAEIISCDSLLFYRGLDVGTAKPTPKERERVPHHLIDVCHVTERMDVTRYIDAVRVKLDEIAQRQRRVLVVGGSGFYLRAYFSPVADHVEVPAALRAEIAARLENEGLTALVQELKSLDPEGSAGLDLNNPRRVTRALERRRASGKSLNQLTSEFVQLPRPFADWAVQLTRLDRAPEALNLRIEERVAAMLRAGLVEEVTRLVGEGLKGNPSASRAIGYRETIDFLEQRVSAAELPTLIARNTRALVKKQRTWFRTQLPEHRVIDASTAEPSGLFQP